MNIVGIVMFSMNFMKLSGVTFAVNTPAGFMQNPLTTHMGPPEGWRSPVYSRVSPRSSSVIRNCIPIARTWHAYVLIVIVVIVSWLCCVWLWDL